jgi:hypothetical protein
MIAGTAIGPGARYGALGLAIDGDADWRQFP